MPLYRASSFNEVVDDTTPQLGGDLDINGKNITGDAGTITAASDPILDLSQTWNGGAVTFNAVQVDVTNTASASASRLLDLQVGSTSQFSVDTDGYLFGKTDSDLFGGNTVRFTQYVKFAGSIMSFGADGNCSLLFELAAQDKVVAGENVALGWSSSTAATPTTLRSNMDTFMYRDGAAGVIALRNGTSAEALRVYDTYTSSTDYHRLGIATAGTTLSGVSGATATASSLIPAGSVPVGITTKITTGLGTGNGTTGYNVGDGVTPDRWGVASAVTAGTVTDGTTWSAGTIALFAAAQDVVITAVGGNFDGTGVIDVSVFYLAGQVD